MKETFSNGWRSFSLLYDYKDYTNKERVLKSFLLPFLFVSNALLFMIVSVFYLIERLFAFAFRYFISLQAKIYRRRMFIKENLRVYFTILSVLVFFVFSPFILIYYGSMGVKTLGKLLMRKLIMTVDFTKHYKVSDLYVFDDTSIHTRQKVSGMMKDLNQTAALGSAFESIMNQSGAGNDNSDERR